jgi:hypothetical protein
MTAQWRKLQVHQFFQKVLPECNAPPADTTVKYPTAIKHSTTIKHPTISRPGRVDAWGQNLRTQGSYEHSYEHCF